MLPYNCPRKIKPLNTRGSDKPEPLYGQAIMLRDNYLYVIGGTTGHLFTCDIYRYGKNLALFNVNNLKYNDKNNIIYWRLQGQLIHPVLTIFSFFFNNYYYWSFILSSSD